MGRQDPSDEREREGREERRLTFPRFASPRTDGLPVLRLDLCDVVNGLGCRIRGGHGRKHLWSVAEKNSSACESRVGDGVDVVTSL